MKNATRRCLPMLLVLALSACSSLPESQETSDAGQGPEFTQAQKDAMTTQDKVALYNAAVEEPDEIVCRRERTVGSRMNKTRCFSRSEQAANNEESREALRRMQSTYLGNRDETGIRGGN